MDYQFIKNIDQYYSNKVLEFGSTPQGVDWNSKESQILRFKQLLGVITTNPCTLLDYGCGYGAMKNHLPDGVEYSGYDISKSMLEHAITAYPEVNWYNKKPSNTFDYVVASGLLNVKLNVDDAEWKNYIIQLIDSFDKLSIKGFAFNALTSYSDKNKQRKDLYYSNPLELFDLCKSRYSKYVSLIHDYPLYEFTIIVRKDE